MTDETLNNRIGDYEILGILGTGGMGRVFKVRNTLSDRIEAMKILLPDLAGQQELADRFLREIKVLAALDHPNIAALRTALTIDNQLIMIMEYVEGETLAKRLGRGPFPVAEAANYIDQALAALSYAHQRGVIHRDIKPSNMMLTPQGVLKLMDFGIARSASERDLTTTGATLGSLYYMSPEQVKAENTDARSDLYSVGVSLYEMVTGQRPFQATSDYSILVAHIEQPPKPPIEIRPDLPAGVNDIILMAMEKDPARRFQSAESFRTALRSVRTSLGLSTGQSPSLDPASVPTAITPVPTAPAAHSYSTQSVQPAPSMTPPPPASVLPPVGQYGPASAANQASHRGLWMGLGALVVLAGLVVAGVYVPRRSKAGAGAQTPALQPASDTQTAAQEGSATAVPAPPEAKAGDIAGAVPPPPSTPPVEVPSSASENTAPAGTAPPPYVNAAETAKSSATIPNSPAHAQRGSAKGANGVTQPAGATSPPASNPNDSAANAAAQAEQAAAAAAAAAQLEELEKEFDQVSTRSNAVSTSLDTLRQQQASQGLNLRGDVAASEERLRTYVNKAQAALQNQDITSAQKYLKLAEPELEKIEKFLGH